MAVYLLWWEHISCLIEGLIASRRLTQGMNMFSASPAGIASGRHAPKQTEPFEKHRVLGVQEDTQEEINTLHLGKKSCSTGISTGSILKDELRVANVWTKWACNDMANASSSQAVGWRVSKKALAVSFANLRVQELLSVRNGSWQRSCLPQCAFTLHCTHGERLAMLVGHACWP